MLWIFAKSLSSLSRVRSRCFDDDDDEFLRIAHKFIPSQNCALESRSDTRASCFAAHLWPRMKHSYFQRNKIQLRNRRQKRLFFHFFLSWFDDLTVFSSYPPRARPVRCLVFLWVVEMSSSISSSFVFEQKGKRSGWRREGCKRREKTQIEAAAKL